MYQQKIAKHLIELNKTDFDSTFNTMTALHTQADQRFFCFVDKNPVLRDNSLDAIYDYLVSSRKHDFQYQTNPDENYETPPVCLIRANVYKG